MLYLIGGPPRVGKSTLAQMLVDKKNVPYVPTDALFHTLKDTSSTPIVDDKSGFDKKAQDLFPYLLTLARHLVWGAPDFCLEGDGFLPQQVKKLSEDEVIKKYQVKCVFLGFSKITGQQLKENMGYKQMDKRLHPGAIRRSGSMDCPKKPQNPTRLPKVWL